MYHDYFDETDATGLRNPYGPEVPLLPEERTSHRQRLLLLGVVGAGLSVVGPAAGAVLPGPGHVSTSAQSHRAGPAPVDGAPADRP